MVELGQVVVDLFNSDCEHAVVSSRVRGASVKRHLHDVSVLQRFWAVRQVDRAGLRRDLVQGMNLVWFSRNIAVSLAVFAFKR